MNSQVNSPAKGIFWMVVTGLMFVAVTALVKYTGGRVPAAQAAFLRYVLGLVFLIPMIGAMRAVTLTRRQWTLFTWRGIVHTLAVICWFYAMTRIPIAEVTAMNYMAPIYVSIGAALFLGERLATRRIIAIAVAMIGALVILRPGFREIDLGHLAMLFTALMFGVGYLITKLLSGEVSAAVVVFMLSVTVTIGLAPFAYTVWVPVSWNDLGILFLVACFATAGHYSMTLAFAAAPVTVTQPVTFLQLLWATILGALVFAEPIDVWVIAGGLLILGSVLFITWREAMLKKETAP